MNCTRAARAVRLAAPGWTSRNVQQARSDAEAELDSAGPEWRDGGRGSIGVGQAVYRFKVINNSLSKDAGAVQR